MIHPLHIYVQKVLPLVYDDSLSYYELLAKVVAKINEIIPVVNNVYETIEQQVTEILTTWYNDGTLEDIIGTTLDNISGRVTTCENDIDALEAVDVTLSNNIAAINNQTPVKAGNNLVIIGDSWAVGSGATNPATERFSTLLANKFGMNEYNFGVGAAGFTITNNTFYDQLETAQSTMTTAQKTKTSLVLIIGGVNDIRHAGDTSREAFISAVRACVTKAVQVFPNALICLACGTTMNDSYTDTNRHWFYGAMSGVKQLQYTGRVLIIDHVGAALNGLAGNYNSDMLHPTTTGYSKLAGFLANAILGGTTETEYYVGMIQFDDTAVTVTLPPHVFRQTENILFGQGIITLINEISSNTVVGSYTGPFGYENIYNPIYHGNVHVGTLVITSNGNVRIVPDTDVTLEAGWQLRFMDHVELFRSLI